MSAGVAPLGEIRLEALRQSPETDWFPLGYDLFSFDDGESYRKILASEPIFERIEILAFIGLWCPDCQDHLPGFSRILDAVRFPASRLRVYALDRAKAFPGGAELIARHGVTRLPTFIFLKDGRELGRIIETPSRSLLKDSAEILARAASA